MNADTKQNIEGILEDLSVFADLGTDSPSYEHIGNNHVIRLVRNGEPTEIVIGNASGAIVERCGPEDHKHASFKSLLASDRFGNLRGWVAKQSAYMQQEIAPLGRLIEVYGNIDDGLDRINLNALDEFISKEQPKGTARVLLIDGPAGIGKTQFIQCLAADRVKNYNKKRRPLILHVQSRGRILAFLNDIIAFSLQSMQLSVLYDQVPILAKHGLITIAIDGFDELADPDGYDTAWLQVNDLIHKIKGAGTLILAGRETFIGRDRLWKDLAALDERIDDLSVLTLIPPSKGDALAWLRSGGWDQDQLDSIEEYLEPSSLALRPFFLKTLSELGVANRISSSSSAEILSILIAAR